jgi:hypothetical protein
VEGRNVSLETFRFWKLEQNANDSRRRHVIDITGAPLSLLVDRAVSKNCRWRKWQENLKRSNSTSYHAMAMIIDASTTEVFAFKHWWSVSQQPEAFDQ